MSEQKYSITKQSGKEYAYVTEYVIDKRMDLEDVPKFPVCAFGSSVLVLEDSSVHMLGNDNEWHEI